MSMEVDRPTRLGELECGDYFRYKDDSNVRRIVAAKELVGTIMADEYYELDLKSGNICPISGRDYKSPVVLLPEPTITFKE